VAGSRAVSARSILDARAGVSHSSQRHQSAWHLLRPANIHGTAMRISARNQIKGTVVEVKKGATTSHIRVDIGGGQIVTSSITNEAVDELGIKVKEHVTVVIKASDVMTAVN
jgi:molybdopterin-binding protein